MATTDDRRGADRLHPGDQVELLRRIAIRPDSVIACEPGDIATIEAVGEQGCLVRIHGMDVAVPHASLRLHQAGPR